MTDTPKGSSPPKRVAYRIKEFSEATGIPYRTVADQVASGKIPSVKFGSVRVIPASYIEARLKAAETI
jgi:excisionase family DNA binding protein